MAEFQNACQIAKEWEHRMPPWAGYQPQLPQNVPEITQRAIDIYMLSKQPDGGMGGIGWWQAACGYTGVALHDYWSGTNRNYEQLAQTLKQCERSHPGLINEFNDDTLWWAMCCVDLYMIGGDQWFLEKAKGIYIHIHGKNSICGKGQIKFENQDMEGACFWTTKPDEGQINSISSGLLAELSARLAIIDGGNANSSANAGNNTTSEVKHPHLSKLQSVLGVGSGAGKQQSNHPGCSREDYIATARCSLNWILRCRYRPREAVVLDAIRLKKGVAVDWTFSYTTGVVLGTCALLYEATHEEEFMTLACHIAHRAMRNPSWVEEGGVLTEHGSYGKGNHDPAKNDDSVGFKSVLMRHLGTLYEVIRRTRASSEDARRTAGLIKTFVNINFESQVKRNTNGNGQFGPWWGGPFECPTSHSQMAVMDVMAAVMLVNRA
ncbi:hypothetical protein LTR08_001443 [Meristemomyces frigidus]|nr:hypothetical protein LTR08_001443 [Meristemomyces frigidus]